MYNNSFNKGKASTNFSTNELPSKYFIYDYETYNATTDSNTISEVAFLQIDPFGNEIAESRHEIRVIPPGDRLPSIGATLVTKIGIKDLLNQPPQGVQQYTERELAYLLNDFMTAQENTCIVGYNSTSFDDKITENLFYRNFIAPYEFRYINKNSRLDLYPLTVAFHTLCPQALGNWPRNESGNFSYRLEDISKANGLEHEKPHAAISDVIACRELMRCYLNPHPVQVEAEVDLDKLTDVNVTPLSCFNFLAQFRNKYSVAKYVESKKEEHFVYFTKFGSRETRSALPVLCLDNFVPSKGGKKVPDKFTFVNLLAEPEDLRTFLSYDHTELEMYYSIANRYRKFTPPVMEVRTNSVPLFANWENCLLNTELNTAEIEERIRVNKEIIAEANIANLLASLEEVPNLSYLNKAPDDLVPEYLYNAEKVAEDKAEQQKADEEAKSNPAFRKSFEITKKANYDEGSVIVFPDSKLHAVIQQVFNNAQIWNAKLGPSIERFVPYISTIGAHPVFNNLFLLFIGDINVSDLNEELQLYYYTIKRFRLDVAYEQFNNEIVDFRKDFKQNKYGAEEVETIKHIIAETKVYVDQMMNYYNQKLAELSHGGDEELPYEVEESKEEENN